MTEKITTEFEWMRLILKVHRYKLSTTVLVDYWPTLFQKKLVTWQFTEHAV